MAITNDNLNFFVHLLNNYGEESGFNRLDMTLYNLVSVKQSQEPIKLVKYLLQTYPEEYKKMYVYLKPIETRLNYALKLAVKNANIEITKLLVQSGANNFDEALQEALANIKIESPTTQYIDKYENNIKLDYYNKNQIVIYLVNTMISKNQYLYKLIEPLYLAAKDGKFEIVQYLLSKLVYDKDVLDKALSEAMIGAGLKSYSNVAITMPVATGYFPEVLDYKRFKLNNYNKTIELLKEYGAKVRAHSGAY